MIATLIGMVVLMVGEADRIEDQMIMNMPHIICIRITPFLGTWFVVFSQLYYTISGEELF